MKRLWCTIAAMAVMAMFLAAPALAAKAPDAGVKGLWLKATGLPKGAALEDMTQDDGNPYFIYSFGKGPDGPAVTMPIGRYPQNDLAERISKLDKKALAEFDGAESFTKTAKDLKFTEAPSKISEKFSYPCQMATYVDSEMDLAHTILFIQTDGYMFSVHVVREAKSKQYSDADVEKWLMGVEMVEQ